MPESAISPDFIAAYTSTRYGVQTDAPFDFTVGQLSAELGLLMAQNQCVEAVYLTACNPFSQVLPAGENDSRQADLAQSLRRTGFTFIPGQGQDTTWPAEPSFLVLGMDLEAGKALGRHWGQNAIIWCGPDAVPQLVLLR